MYDPRLDALAHVLITYSTGLKRGEKVLIEAVGADPEAVIAVMRAARARGGIPLVTLKDTRVMREILRGATAEQLKLIAAGETYRMKRVDAYIAIRGGANIFEYADVPAEKMQLYASHWVKPVHLKVRVPKTKWVVLRYPSPSMAQQAGMSTEAFEEFFFAVCTVDYRAMSKAMRPLERLMNRTKKVRITGPGTDITLSIEGMPAVKCDGRMNIPDGEVFTAPVKDSVNGVVTFNAPSVYEGLTFEDVCLTFKNGKVVNATCNHTARLNEILDGDAGARYVGEFALGVNPRVTRPMKDTLFDEKIAGSFHMALGNAYEGEADNGNRSQIHWDLVCMQTPAAGGGQIEFDGTVVRKNGRFVPTALKPLDRVGSGR
jgi:aminopeptidase